MALLPMPLNNLEGHICCLKPFYLQYLVKHSMNLITWHRHTFTTSTTHVTVSDDVLQFYQPTPAVVTTQWCGRR